MANLAAALFVSTLRVERERGGQWHCLVWRERGGLINLSSKRKSALNRPS